MKNIIWSLIEKFFKSELISYRESFKEVHYREKSLEQDQKRIKINYPIGQKVIVRSNEPDELFIGEVVSHQMHKNSGKILLVIEDKNTGQTICPLNNEPPYWTQEREDALNKLNWAEQWNVLSKYYDIDLDHQKYKESPEYQNRNK